MKKGVTLLTMCLFFTMATNALLADEISIKWPFAFQDRFPPGLQHIGFNEGDVFKVGCFIQRGGSPIKEVTMKNLDTGLVLTANPVSVGGIFSDLYQAIPMPPFDPSKHLGVWEIRAKDEAGNEGAAKTHKLNIKGKMPFLKGLKASGNPFSPTITWMAPNKKDLPKGVVLQYRVRLLTDINNQFYRSSKLYDTTHQIPEGLIKSEDLSRIYVRVECQGWDKNEFGLKQNSQTIMLLKEALGKQ